MTLIINKNKCVNNFIKNNPKVNILLSYILQIKNFFSNYKKKKNVKKLLEIFFFFKLY